MVLPVPPPADKAAGVPGRAAVPDVGALAEQRLHSNPYLALRQVTCAYRDGVLTLQGRLPTYYLRQVAQTVVAGMEGVEAIVDEIEVVPPVARNRRQETPSAR